MPTTRLREERQSCWDTRDAYYACLDVAGVVVPGQESSKLCRAENKAFVKNCAKSWVSYAQITYVGEHEIHQPFPGR